MNRVRVLKLLKNEKGWLAVKNGKDAIKIARVFGKERPKVIEFSLVCHRDGIYIEHPHYQFKSTISHFSSTQTDVRLSLNKSYLASLIKALKNIEVWDSIRNKDFLVVNDNNKKTDKIKVERELKRLLG